MTSGDPGAWVAAVLAAALCGAGGLLVPALAGRLPGPAYAALAARPGAGPHHGRALGTGRRRGRAGAGLELDAAVGARAGAGRRGAGGGRPAHPAAPEGRWCCR